ncbi:MAG TPA: hypothetical protein VMN58_07255 [Acidimicrobiales bacterium]|nr:hypothetical protein [Acidimicrobiales bacterium]
MTASEVVVDLAGLQTVAYFLSPVLMIIALVLWFTGRRDPELEERLVSVEQRLEMAEERQNL